MAGDLYFSVILVLLFGVGLKYPHVALCGAILIDLLTPQHLSSAWLRNMSLAAIAAAILVVSATINSKKCSIPTVKWPIFIFLFFMVWITYTTIYAQFQDAAWFKHDYVIKTLFIALFFPFVLNTRSRIDAAIAVIVGAISYYVIVGAVRTLLGGIAYGEQLVAAPGGLLPFAETSTLSMVAIMIIPLALHLHKNSSFRNRAFKSLLIVIIVCCVITAIGTQARTGLVAIGTIALLIAVRGSMKVKISMLSFLVIVAVSPIVTDRWVERMSTLTDVEAEGSAVGRIIVWRWTIDYVAERPWGGGGFMAYQANAGALREYAPDDVAIIFHDVGGKAFHSIYFEVLGEHGYVGLATYTSLLLITLLFCRRIVRRTAAQSWESSLARSISDSLIIFMVCGNFIGVAFTQWPYYYLGIAIALHHVLIRETTN